MPVKQSMEKELLDALEKLTEEINRILPDLLVGFYVFGHATWEDFNHTISDVNCIAITKKEVTEQETKLLEASHRIHYKQHRKYSLSAAYLWKDDLGKSAEAIPSFPYFSLGTRQSESLFELNDLTWWQLKNNSITISGMEAKELGFEITKERLIDYAHENMRGFQKDWLKDLNKWWTGKYWGFIYSDALFEWTIAGVARQYYILKNKSVTSMKGGLEYCLKNCPSEFHNVLKEAIRIRKKEEGTIYPSKWLRRKEGLAFVIYLIDESDRPVENFYL
jgi:hypothetical protein